jgi:hypothetical protein
MRGMYLGMRVPRSSSQSTSSEAKRLFAISSARR